MVWVLLLLASPLRAEEAGATHAPPVAMWLHSADARVIREALVKGQLEAAQAAGLTLAGRLPIAGLPEGPQIPVRDAALALSRAPSIEVAARSFGMMSAACGECHSALGVTPQLPAPPLPPSTEGFPEQMQRYHWAAERMWQGLVLPSEAAFSEARAQLDAIPAMSTPPPEGIIFLSPDLLDTVLHEQAQLTGPGRGAAYGAMLLTCAACHVVSPESPAHD